MNNKPNNTLWLYFAKTFVGIVFGFILGVSVPRLAVFEVNPGNCLPTTFVRTDASKVGDGSGGKRTLNDASNTKWVQTNPRGSERLPPGIVVSESDLFLRRLWGDPSEDVTVKPKYLVTFTVGYNQRKNIEECIKKFSDNFTILLFHYDGRTSEWDEFEWSKRAIHVSARNQTKWWFAKRFLHPDIVAQYDYIFIWDEDLEVEHFDAEKYIDLVKKHELEISQPALGSNSAFTWLMTKRRDGHEVHKEPEEKPDWCRDPPMPPCVGFIEIMAPVFSQDAWSCVWYMIQNDLVHGWGLDFALRKCVEHAQEKIGVVDAQWVVHRGIPSLGNQGNAPLPSGLSPREGVRQRSKMEWEMFRERLKTAEELHEKRMRGSRKMLRL